MRIVTDQEHDCHSRWAVVVSMTEMIGCVPLTLHEWVKALKCEVRELRQANEILRKASAYFA